MCAASASSLLKASMILERYKNDLSALQDEFYNWLNDNSWPFAITAIESNLLREQHWTAKSVKFEEMIHLYWKACYERNRNTSGP